MSFSVTSCSVVARWLASPFTPLEIPLGQACEFNVYHLMKVDSPTALFPIQIEEIA